MMRADLEALIRMAGSFASGAGVLRECCNAECDWTGETDRMLGSVGPLCPDCGEVTEPAGVDVPQEPDEAQPLYICPTCKGTGGRPGWCATCGGAGTVVAAAGAKEDQRG
jgi:hypothetical protein